MNHTAKMPVLTARAVSKTYRHGTWPDRQVFKALDSVDLEVCAGSTLALVGASGVGKSTLALCLGGFEQPDTGEIAVRGGTGDGAFAPISQSRRQVQLMWQDASSAMSPYFTAGEIVEEPMRIRRSLSRLERAARVIDLFRMVDLRPEWTERKVNQLSGGQRQRVGIARALAADPLVLILDEPFSGLDLSVRNQILNLLLDLQESQCLAYIYISHDLDVVRFFADELLVMRSGRIVSRLADDKLAESGCVESVSMAMSGAGAEQYATAVES